MNKKNIFVLRLTELQHEELATVVGAEDVNFRSVLDYESLVNNETIDFEKLLAQCQHELEQFEQSGGTVDAIIAHWDFPVSILAPVLAHERGLPSPS